MLVLLSFEKYSLARLSEEREKKKRVVNNAERNVEGNDEDDANFQIKSDFVTESCEGDSTISFPCRCASAAS